MKKILTLGLVILFALSMMAACGDKGGGSAESGTEVTAAPAQTSDTPAPEPAAEPEEDNETNEPSEPKTRIIFPSELLSQEEAAGILGVEVKPHDKKFDYYDAFTHGSLSTIYVSVDDPLYFISSRLYQDAMLFPQDQIDEGLIELGGTKFFIDSERENHENDEYFFEDVVGDWAWIYGYDKLRATNTHFISIAYNDYLLKISILGWQPGSSFSDEEKIAWKTEKFIEAGKIEIEHLKEHVG